MTDLNERIAALREAVRKMTPGEWMEGADDRNGQATVRGPHFEVASFWHHCVGGIEKEMRSNAAGIVALRNNALAIINEQQREIERLRSNEELLLKIAKGMGELGVAVRDAGPTPLRGRITARNRPEDEERN